MENYQQVQSDNWSFTRLSPSGEGGIGVFYLSGPDVNNILDRIFTPASGGFSRTEQALYYGWLTEDGESIDEVVVRFVDPGESLTGDPAAELNTHSGPAILNRISSLLDEFGGTELDPEAFLERAERNGALDHLQRQAYAALMEVETRRGAAMLSNQLRGALTRSVQGLLNRVASDRSGTGELNSVQAELSQLIRLGESGVAMTDPRDLCILGPPNAGKSTLMNALSQRNTSIVHEDAGTTRDVVHDTVFALGYPFRVRDTAGLRPSGDRIERTGIEKAKQMAVDADLVLWVGETVEEARSCPDFIDPDKVLSIRNKEDLAEDPSYGTAVVNGVELVRISAEEEDGIQALRECVIDHLGLEEELPVDTAVPFQEDQLDQLQNARTSLNVEDIPEAKRALTSLLSSNTEE